MILDKLMQFDAGASLASTIVGAGVDSYNTLDLLNARDLAIAGEHPMQVVFTITTTFLASGGAASLTIRVYSSADDTTYTLLAQTAAIAKAGLTAGTVIRLPLPPIAANPNAALPRYLKVNYLATTNDFTTGAFECDLVVDPQASNPPTYPAGVTVTN